MMSYNVGDRCFGDPVAGFLCQGNSICELCKSFSRIIDRVALPYVRDYSWKVDWVNLVSLSNIISLRVKNKSAVGFFIDKEKDTDKVVNAAKLLPISSRVCQLL